MRHYNVSGSDLKESATTKRLRGLGATLFMGHAAENVAGADVVVKSTAVPAENPEIRAAEASHIPVIPRAEMLAELMRMKYGVAIAGTHGKTTTTSMIATCHFQAGMDPTVVIGGRLNTLGSSARRGLGEFMVAEADESDGSFMLLPPTVAVVTNIDPEHLDHWGSMEALVDGFAAFASKVPFYGFAALCLDHPVVQGLLPRLRRRVVTYGLSASAEVRGDNIVFDGMSTRFRVWWKDQPLGEIQLGMPGGHNTNWVMTLSFALSAAIGAWPGRRIIAVVQPHRYSRVADLFEDFARCLNAATHVVVTPLYSAGEAPIPGIDHTHLALRLSELGHRSVYAADGLDEATAHLRAMLRPGDVVLTLGAGDVNRVLADLASSLIPRTLPGQSP